MARIEYEGKYPYIITEEGDTLRDVASAATGFIGRPVSVDELMKWNLSELKKFKDAEKAGTQAVEGSEGEVPRRRRTTKALRVWDAEQAWRSQRQRQKEGSKK